ncbi:hypothetical protein MAR_013678 [Mya arenaria]|uniref:Chitin-binding type-2 domain-containing protein n=1 Tax=Mya arenaria TaxID=6604 RepID=A0ABY7G374_MYAAR|nr:hypothetical protein MAR_013678 [Mya arenaria]
MDWKGKIIVLSICTYILILPTNARMKRGKYEFLESFCKGPDVYVAIPWDCTGYVHCSNLGNQPDAYWIECPLNLYYSMEHRTCMWPKDSKRPCPALKDIIENYCLDNPVIRFQNPDHCAQYYDCSDASFTPGLGPYLKECTFPMLYDPTTNMCTNRLSVNCMDRFTPSNKCDYVQHAGTGVNCEVITTPGCEGMPDGPNPYPNRLLTAYYLMCRGNRTVSTQMCTNGDVFDPIKFACTKDIDMLSIEVYCAQHLGDERDSPANCAQYIDCRPSVSHPTLGRHMAECPYPQLFSSISGRCENYEMVQCGTRYEPRAPCEYATLVGSGSVTNCQGTYYSCVGLPDGPNPVPSGLIDTKYVMCQTDRTVDVTDCPAGKVYDHAQKLCTITADQDLITTQCTQNPFAMLPDPDNCARYFNCSQRVTLPNLVQYQEECDYPFLFNTQTSACDDFSVVACGTRLEPKAPCDYLSTTTKCEGPLCSLPCLERSPSCVGMPNGNNTYPGRDLSPFYMTCLGERTQTVGICRFGVYDPTLRACTTELDPISIELFCQKNPTGIIPHYTNCARYYNCSSATPTPEGNSYLQECLYPQLFNLDKMTCDPYSTVQCTFRYEPKGPCEYIQNQACPGGAATCLPCEQRIPSCLGLENGNNSFPGRDNFHVVCQDQRTMFVRECVGETFDPLTRACKVAERFDINRPGKFCALNPTATVASPLSCAQYFDCSSQVTELGKYKRECPYPQLFDELSGRCAPYNLVSCGGRFVAVDPLRRCAGNGIYDPMRGCQVAFDIGNPVPYCTAYPNALLPNPDNCAQFFDCRQQNTMFGNYLRECPYLQLYSDADKTCHSFDRVPCGDYLQNVQCYDPAGCPPCPSLKPSCLGLPNGNNSFPGRPKEFIVCAAERTIAMEQCVFDFDVMRRECGQNMSDPMIFCSLRPNGVMPHPSRCHQYFDCRQFSTRYGETYLSECTYPALFDERLGVCANFMDVQCGARYEPLSACPGCMPCESRFVSCEGKLDGNNSYPGQEMSRRFTVCQKGRTFGEGSCPTGYFDPVKRVCSTRLDAVSIQLLCQQSPGLVVTNPLHCAQYIDCSNTSVAEGTFLRECPYPMLFHEDTLVCQNFTTGLPDGDNPHPGRELTEHYIVCQQGRTMAALTCSNGVFFPDKRECNVVLDEAMAVQFCGANPSAIVPHQMNCAQYFDCNQAVYPQLFDELTNMCRNFSDVSCGMRFEAQAPCEYLQTRCLSSAVNCTPCPERLPSCIGLPNGNNPFPTRPNSQYYVNCFMNRTVAVEVCQVSLFDPVTRECSSVIDAGVLRGFCQENPSVLIPDPNHCARFYNCSDPSVRQGLGVPHLHECKYPRLFGYGGTSCQLFTEITCETRYEPKAPCEYVENQCFNATCAPCLENYPTCVDKQDGSNHFPGREGTEYYIVCYKHRTVAIVTCTTGFYNHASRSCEVVNPNTGAVGGSGSVFK